MRRLDLLGACVALCVFTLSSLVFVARMLRRPALEYWLGAALLMAAVPLTYLLARAPADHRPPLYILQLCLMLLYLIVEAIVDYIAPSNFRTVRPLAIAYVMLFFAGTGGMLGVARLAGPAWTVAAVLLYLVMAGLAFAQHAVTGA